MLSRGKKATVLTFVAAGGVVVTVVLTGKLAPIAKQKKEAALAEKRKRLNDPNAQLTWWESVQAQLGSYLPVILSLLATTGSIFGSDILNKRNFNQLKLYSEEFKKMSDQLAGEGHSKLVEKAMEKKEQDKKDGKPDWGEKQWFALDLTPVDVTVHKDHPERVILFESTMAEVIQAEYEVNRYFHGNYEITNKELLQCFGLEQYAEKNDDKIGFDCTTGEAFYGYSWIDFEHYDDTEHYDKDVIRIHLPFAPHPMYEAMNDYDQKVLEGGSHDSD